MLRRDRKNVAVVGLGRVGLPFAVMLSRRGFTVFGVDKDPARVAKCRRGILPFAIGLPQREFRAMVGRRFFPVRHAGEAESVDVWVITVGAGKRSRGDLGAAASALRSILPFLGAGQCVILRSTLPPGSTKKFSRLIERRTPLRVGRTIFLAYCPERALEGRLIAEAPRLPQIIGADDPASARAARRFFRFVTKKTLVSGSVAAEFAKLFANTYRYATFALANEFTEMAEGAGQNIFEILRLVNEGYSRGGIPRPGFAGGPCLPKSALALAGRSTIFPSASYRVNESLPRFLAVRIRRHFGGSLKGRRIAMLGIAFKGNVDDMRGSLALEAERIFRRWGAVVRLHDPFLRPGKIGKILRGSDVVFVGARHDAYGRISPRALRRMVGKSVLVCDIWNMSGRGKIFFRI